VSRNNYPIDNCIEYNDTKDLCSSCSEKYFLSSSKRECEEFPNRVENCLVYDQERECLRCVENMFLENNKCFLLPVTSVISLS
jgi:hypothetical protein